MLRVAPVSGLTLASLAILVALLAGCRADASSGATAGGETRPQVVAVRAAEVRAPEAGEPLRFAGVVCPRERATLTFQVGGVVRERPVEIGQSVEKGALLARLFNPELDPARDAARARLRELEAQAEQARGDAERAAQLHARGMASAQERDRQAARLDAAHAAVATARAGLRQSEQLQREMRLEAPFAATIEALLVEPGEYVGPGQPVMRLAGAENGLEVEVKVPVSLLEGVAVGDLLPLWTRLDGEVLRGRVVEIGRSASQGSVLYPVVVGVDEARLRAGDAVEVGFARQGDARAAVPFAAVMRSADGLAVFRLEGDRVRRVEVAVAGLQGEWALLDGDTLKPGDRVVHSGLARLTDNDSVRLLP